jgi:hypothetical protein
MHVVQPTLQFEVGLLDFGHSAELIDAGYHQTLEYFRALTQQKSVDSGHWGCLREVSRLPAASR